MIRLVAQSALIAVLATGLMYQTAVLWRLWQAPVTASVATPGPQIARAKKSDSAPLSLIHLPIGKYQQTLARPLFVDGRRPPQAKSVIATPAVVRSTAPPPPPLTLDRYRLLGIHLDGSVRRALIETPSGTRAWVAQGDRIDEWSLVEVEADRARLSVRDLRGELRLYPAKPGG